MASAFEFFGVKTAPTRTPVSPLGVDQPLFKLQTQSKQYFSINENAAAEDNNVLALTAHEEFSEDNPAHLAHLNASTACFKQKSDVLKSIDMKIITGLAVVITASTLSFLPLAGYAFWLGLGAAAYHLQQRSQAYSEYEQSLTLVVANCNWSLGDVNNLQAIARVGNQTIRNMMAALYPVLTETQVKHLIADRIEEDFAQELRQYEESFHFPIPAQDQETATLRTDDQIALSKKGAEFNRCIYGFNKGTPVDFLDACMSFLPDLYNAANDGVAKLKHWWHEGSAPTPAR